LNSVSIFGIDDSFLSVRKAYLSLIFISAFKADQANQGYEIR